ncbi:MAG TPA: class I SAM-dependent methyltransferase [Candidatus Limnocylindria bacterium]|nr:class I SAM-dependent methyltransferase [Candidatus Limnocylindria bacterium]
MGSNATTGEKTGLGSRTFGQKLAGWLADSALMLHGRSVMERNWKDCLLPLSKWQKLSAGGYLILKDYSNGLFPPTFADQAKAYQAEIDYFGSIPGTEKERMIHSHIVKPFWGAYSFGKYSRDFIQLQECFDALGLKQGDRLLELGCGCGWTAEFLALSGYRVVGTTIAPDDVLIANKRAEALATRGLSSDLMSFKVAPMETVDQAMGDDRQFDAVFVFEALHHAFDWRQATQAACRCLKPGGWLLLANEPNLSHTFVSYRISRLTNTHEIGMSQAELIAEMKRGGCGEIKIFQPGFDNRVTAHWLAGRKAG